jgi:hypothetical protein
MTPTALRTAEQWIAERREVWERRLDRLGEFLAEQADDPAPPGSSVHPHPSEQTEPEQRSV